MVFKSVVRNNIYIKELMGDLDGRPSKPGRRWNDEEGKLGNERYKLVAFATFGLVLFPSEIKVISLKAKNSFMEYERT